MSERSFTQPFVISGDTLRWRVGPYGELATVLKRGLVLLVVGDWFSDQSGI